MADLYGVERNGHRTTRYWRHIGDDNRKKFTVETVEDVEPVIKAVKRVSEYRKSPRDTFRLKASLPVTLIEEMAKINAKLWGISVREAFSELVTSRTDRAKRVMRMLTEGRDYNKLQAKTYEP